MKKILLSAVAFVAAMSVNAQVFQVVANEMGVNPEDANYNSDNGIAVEAGKVWGDNDAFTASNPFATNHKQVDCKNNGYNSVSFDGNVIVTKNGLQGQDNPKDADSNNPATSLKPAASGAVIQIDAKKDGFVYVVGKLSSNKNYVVFEEGAAIGYKLAMEINDNRFPNNILSYEVKGSGEYNYVTLENKEGGIQWAVREALGDVEAATAGNGLGVIYFPVAKGCKYYAHACGSKISWSGIYFSEKEAASVVLNGEDSEKNPISLALVGGEAGISNVKADKVNGAIFNLAGQKVAANFKGIAIQNGKKVVLK